MKYFNEKADRFWADYTVANFNKINVKPGKCRYNFRCSFNAVHEAIEAKQDKIAMVMYLDEDTPIIHFLNFNGKNYTDNTLGHWSQSLDYYFIKWIEKEDFFNVGQIFSAYRKHLQNILPLHIRLFSNNTC